MPLLDITWRPTVGDPTVIDWVITVAYLVAAGFCFRAWRRERRPELRAGLGRAAAPGFWLLLAVLLAFLGVNKQLDLQTLLTQVGRDASEKQGWYEHRRAVQKLFVLALGLGGLASLAALAWWLRRAWRRYLWPLAGLAVLFGYVMVRAAYFEHQSIVAGEKDEHQAWDAAMELLGNALVIAGACLVLRRTRDDAGGSKYQAFEKTVRIR